MVLPLVPYTVTMSKSRSHSQSPPVASAIKLEDVEQEGVKPEEQDVKLTPDTSAAVKPEPSPPPKREPSESSTPAPNVKLKRSGPLLIGDLPLAEQQARATFTEIADNHYQYSTLGRSREALEGMTCDCQYEPGQSGLVQLVLYVVTSTMPSSLGLLSCRSRPSI